MMEAGCNVGHGGPTYVCVPQVFVGRPRGSTAAGNTNPAPLQAVILLDSTPPAGSVTLSASDALTPAGQLQMQVSNDASFSGAVWQAYNSSLAWTLPAALGRIGIQWGGALVATGAIIGMISTLLVTLYGQIRIFMVMARDGLLPPAFAKVHPKHQTPHLCTWITGTATALIAGLFPLPMIIDLCNIGTLFAFVLVSVGVILLRKTRPEVERKFKTPGVPFTPLITVGFCFYLMYSLPKVTWIRFGVWLHRRVPERAFYQVSYALLFAAIWETLRDVSRRRLVGLPHREVEHPQDLVLDLAASGLFTEDELAGAMAKMIARSSALRSRPFFALTKKIAKGTASRAITKIGSRKRLKMECTQAHNPGRRALSSRVFLLASVARLL